MKTLDRAFELACAMTDIGRRAGKSVAAVITSMEQPLGSNIGGNLEIEGVLEVLRGAENDLCAVSSKLTGTAYCMYLERVSNKKLSESERNRAFKEAADCIGDGRAYKKLQEIIAAHGGEFTDKFDCAKYSAAAVSEKTGYITAVDAEKLGLINVALGGGRKKKGDIINHRAGLKLYARLNSRVIKGDTLAILFSDDETALSEVAKSAAVAFTVGNEKIKLPELIVGGAF